MNVANGPRATKDELTKAQTQLELEVQASTLQSSINKQNVDGNEFNRHEAETKIEQDFKNNHEILVRKDNVM